MSIRFKVILPYLLLTLLVAVTGVYVVTRLVANTLSERLTNQLLEAGRVVSDDLVRQEIKHVESARIIAYTRGLAEALEAGDRKTVSSLASPVVSGLGVENLILIDTRGQELLHLIKEADGDLAEVEEYTGAENSPIVQPLLSEGNPEAPPRRGLGENLVDGRHYYFTAIPIPLNGRLAGIVVIGTSLDSLLPYFKNTSLADIVIYGNQGEVIGSTLRGHGVEDEGLADISISELTYQEVLLSNDVVNGENFSLDGRSYSLARAPLEVGNDRLGAFAVVLPSNFVIQSGAVSRNTYVVLFTLAMLSVVLIGYAISRLIINPLNSLVITSRAVAGGNLQQRTGIRSSDEIGFLANTFDEMTERLHQRTIELERTNQVLEQMDRTKASFIQISAHELRTPLTLILGYSQMLNLKTSQNAEIAYLTEGIREGAGRMKEIVNSMLDVSKIDSNLLDVQPTNLFIDEIIEKVLRTLKPALMERNLTVHMVGLNDLPPVPGDPDLLHKVFYQIITNAVKYTPDGGSITVTGEEATDETPANPQIEIAIRDTGIGIDPQNHDLIFEKFYQTGEVLLHSSGKTKFKGGGPGLGLAIARGIIDAHKGRIWVESPGCNELANPGSTFHVRLPLNGNGHK